MPLFYTRTPRPARGELVSEYAAGIGNLATVRIYYFPDSDSYLYHVEEPVVTRKVEEYYEQVPALMREILLKKGELPAETSLAAYEELFNEAAEALLLDSVLTRTELRSLKYYVLRDMAGWGPIDVPMRDPRVEEVDYSNPERVLQVIVKHPKVYAKWVDTNIRFELEDLAEIVKMLAARSKAMVTRAKPIVEARTPEGYRLTVHTEEVGRGPAFTIRKFPEQPLSIVDLIRFKTMSPLVAAYLWTLVEAMKFILVIGEMGSGKTTVLQALTAAIPWDSKVVTIEDVPELRLAHPRWHALYTRRSRGVEEEDIDLFKLARTSLRTRADYIIIGEVRDKEAYVLAQMAATGHGAMCTFHAADVTTLFLRLVSPPLNVERSFLLTVGAVVLQRQTILPDGSRVRRTAKIWEVVGPAPQGSLVPVESRVVVEWSLVEDKHYPDTAEELVDRSVRLREIGVYRYGERYWRDLMVFELSEKERFLRELAEKGVTDYRAVTRELSRFRTRLRTRVAERFRELAG